MESLECEILQIQRPPLVLGLEHTPKSTENMADKKKIAIDPNEMSWDKWILSVSGLTYWVFVDSDPTDALVATATGIIIPSGFVSPEWEDRAKVRIAVDSVNGKLISANRS